MATGDKSLWRNMSRGVRTIDFYQTRLSPMILIHSTKFQHLETLNLSSLLPVRFPQHWISRLPDSIRTLSFPDPKEQISANENFPRQLTLLKIPGSANHTAIIPCLPPSLASFIISGSFDPQLVSSLPPHLTHLECATKVSNESIALLGRGITRLELTKSDALTDDCNVNLPPRLTHLRLCSPSLTSDFFLNLPHTLQKLYLPDSKRLGCEIATMLPPTLRTLHVPKKTFEGLLNTPFKSIPASITDIDLSAAMLTAEIIDLIPLSLIAKPHQLPDYLRPDLVERFLPQVGSNFRIPAWLPIASLTLDRWMLLPSTLTNLDLGAMTESYFPVLRFSPFLHLPRSLETLRADSVGEMSEADFAALPQGLKVLRIISLRTLTDHEVEILPPRLTVLELGALCKITGASAKLLPRTLRIFAAGKNTCFSSDTIVDLPRGLEVLDLIWSASIDDSAIPHLPRSLKDLRLNHAFQLTDASLPFFPPNLTMLDLAQSTLLSHAALTKRFSNKVLIILPYGRNLEDPPW